MYLCIYVFMYLCIYVFIICYVVMLLCCYVVVCYLLFVIYYLLFILQMFITYHLGEGRIKAASRIYTKEGKSKDYQVDPFAAKPTAR